MRMKEEGLEEFTEYVLGRSRLIHCRQEARRTSLAGVSELQWKRWKE